MKTLTFKKLKKEVSVENKNNKIVVSWNGHTGIGEKLAGNKLFLSGGFTANGSPVTGFNIEDDKTRSALEALFSGLNEKRNKAKEVIIEQLISGEKKLVWKIVGCDFRQYSPAIEADEDWNFCQHDIIEAACERLTGDFIYQNIGEWLQKLLNVKIMRNGEERSYMSNIQNDRDIQIYHDYVEDVITSFETALSDVVAIYTEKKKTQEPDEVYNQALKKAKETGKAELVRKVSGYDSDADGSGRGWININEYVKPDGSTYTSESASY